jgi:hypothetical protein
VRQKKKVERAVKGLQDWLAKSGIATETIQEATEYHSLTKQELSLQAEAVLLSLDKPLGFVTKLCRLCGVAFETNYRSVAYCSDAHRAKALKAQGIIWNPHKTQEERWGGEPPLVIPPEARTKLLEWARTLVAQENEIQPLQNLESDGLALPDSGFDWEDDPIQVDARQHQQELGLIPQQESRPRISETHTSPEISLPSLDDLLA